MCLPKTFKLWRNYLAGSLCLNLEKNGPKNHFVEMELWKGKVAVVTGASSGIGASIAKEIALQGVIVVGLARRVDRLNELKKEIVAIKSDAVFHAVKCDLVDENEIKTAFEYIVKTLGGVDILINNAGVAKKLMTLDGDLDDLKKIINLNLVGVISCTKKAYKSMSDRDVPGYIINISSVAGYSVVSLPGYPPLSNVYCPTKHGVRALNTVLRHELNHLKKTNIRISNISPGLVKSELTEDIKGLPILEEKDISDAVLYLLGTNPRVQVEDVIIRPTGEMF